MAVGKLEAFSPPAHLDDFEKGDLSIWDKFMDDSINQMISDLGYKANEMSKVQFFNPKTTDHDLQQTPVSITWVGAPLKLRIQKPTDDARWKAAEDPANQKAPLGYDDREMMDEYLEWSTRKAEKEIPGKALKGDVMVASFTCEAPEYWEKLSNQYPIKCTKNPNGSDKILNIYKQMNPLFKDEIEGDHLVDADGWYDPRNRWNGKVESGTIAHLIQRNNTLGAEVNIAAEASKLRRDLSYGRLMTNIIELCGRGGRYGSDQRNSDPVIGAEVNCLVREGLKVCVSNPIALYMHAADFSSFRLDPTGLRRGNIREMVPVPKGTFQFLRGNIKDCQGVHLMVAVPPGDNNKATKVDRQLNVSDLFDLNHGGQYVRYGSQFADYINISVSGIVANSVVPKPIKKWDSLKFCEPFAPRPFDSDTRVIAYEARRAIEDQKKKDEDAKRKKEEQDKKKEVVMFGLQADGGPSAMAVEKNDVVVGNPNFGYFSYKKNRYD